MPSFAEEQQEQLKIRNTVKKSLNLDNGTEDEEEVIINNTITAAESIKNRYGIRQQIVTVNSNEDSYIKAMRILTDNCKPKEDIEVECIGDLDYRVGFGVHVQIPFLSQYTDCLMYIKSVDHDWKPNGMFISKLILTPSRVMDEQDWSDTTESNDSDSSGNSDLWNKIYLLLKQQIGKPYVWSAAGPDSFDCSGLVYYCYNQFSDEIGEKIDRTTYDQVKQGTKVDESNMDEWEPGDLVFPHAGHVVVYVGNGQCIEALQKGTNVMIHDYSRKTTYAVRRVLPEAKESTSTLSNDFSKGNSYASTKYIEWLEDKEGFRAKVYNDGVGVPTIGYGCTAAVTSILGFNPISKGTCTQLEAEQWLIKILNYYGEILKKKLKVLNVSLVQCKVDALLDACYYSPSWLYNNNHNLWKLIKGENGVTAKQAFASLLGSNALSGNFTRANQLADMWTKGTYTKGY